MPDKIHIKDLELFCNHGVFPEETKLGQKFLLSLTLYTDTREAGRTDDLTKSIHYGDVSHMAKTYLQEHTFLLIEAAAEGLAAHLLRNVERLERVDVELKKPWAPVGLPLDTVSVEISRQWHTAWIALGSNMGDRKGYLDMAVETLKSAEDVRLLTVSEYIETEPYGVTDQAPFLNGALVMRTLDTPQELLERLHRIEEKAERVRTRRWGPRTLDLDILFYDDLVLDTPTLHIPHADLHRRDFVLTPLASITPWKRHPVLGKTVEELKGELHD